MNSRPKQSFVYGAIILVVANAIGKILGAFYKIPLANLLGSTGMAYYNAAYNIYSWIFVISTAGLPVAISKLVSESYALGKTGEVKQIKKIAFFTFISIGILGTAILFIGAQSFANMVNSPKSAISVMAIAPAMLFVCVMSAYRGYYQGLQNMYPTAVSEIVISGAKLFIGFSAAYYISNLILTQPMNGEYPFGFSAKFLGLSLKELALPLSELTYKFKDIFSSAGAIMGVTAGTAISMIYLIFYNIFSKDTLTKQSSHIKNKSNIEIFKNMLKIAIPITLGASVISLTNLLDLVSVMNRLTESGFTVDEANWLYGNYSGFAVPLFNFPPSLIFMIGISIIPALSSAFAVKDMYKINSTIESALRITAMLAFPSAAGLSVLSGPILNLLFFTKPEDAKTAAPLLGILAIAVFFVCITSVTNAVLQSMGYVNIPVFSMLIGGLIKLISNFILVAIPKINIYGAPISTNLCYAVIAAINLCYIAKKTDIISSFGRIFSKPLTSTLAMSFTAAVTYFILAPKTGSRFATLLSISIGIFIYAVSLIFSKGIYKEDIT